jgi:tetratricopeptide (TPR) repeat protein
MSVRRPLSPSLALLLASTTLAPVALAQMPLAEVAKVARARAERARPAQEEALKPFWGDLVLDPRENARHLEARITQVAALGDAVVPLLLEKLQPAQSTQDERNLATNCRRVLEKLDPASFLDALVELANGRNDIGRTEAIRLLGLAHVPQATNALVDLLERVTGDDKRLILRSLRLQRAASAAPKVVPMLASSDPKVREDVLSFLIAAKAGAVADTVVQALGTERDVNLLPTYVEYFGAAVREHDAAARALVPLLDAERLDWFNRKRLVQVLATVAPKDHEPTIRRLQDFLDNLKEDTTSLAVETAVTLRALGDPQGVTKLKRTFAEQIRKTNRKKEAGLYEQRGNLLLATEDYAEAFEDFEKALEFTDGMAMTRKAYVGMLRCQARRKNKTTDLLRLMRESRLTVPEIELIASEDPVFAEVLQHEKVRTFLQQLAKEQAPK